ncbi:methylmalonyl Co-A mutase-associated GTPase MeaB [Neobacillus sp. NPDC097160]|uniref:methylmalonyl Co-A mutase-associated GTPase MeaB n=1 Tax=Neobacillus sp. NPDC097160 TaxID=3364298 RepID=UPI003812888E
MPKWLEKKDNLTLGKLLKEVENQTPLSTEILKSCYSNESKAHIVGITGPPGAGKSTLVSKLCKAFAAQGLKIAVVCVDPTSPFTNGALLGDRIRMQELAKLPDVFIKSLATRGNLGGLAASTADIVQVFGAFKMDLILIETVGVGQIEFDVLEVSDTVILVNVPGLGDSLQTLKAGIMEIADVFVINQADRPGADESVKDLRLMVRESGRKDWDLPILKTVATRDEGIKELVEQIFNHKSFLLRSGSWKEKRQTRNMTRLNHMILHLLTTKVDELTQTDEYIKSQIQDVRSGNIDPFTVSHEIVNQLVSK